MGRDHRHVDHQSDAQHRNAGSHTIQDHHEKLQRDAHTGPQTKGTTGEGSGPPNKPITTGGEGSGPPTTTSNPPGEGTGPPGEGSGPPGGGHHEKTPPVIFTPPWKPPIYTYPVTPPNDTTPPPPTTKNPPDVYKIPEIPVLLKTPPVIPEEHTSTRDITVSNPQPKDPGKTPPPPPGVFTGQGGDGPGMERKYKRLYTSGKYSAHAGEESLTAPSIGLNHIKVNPVGTGAEMHLKGHRTEMVAPKQATHLGEWKHKVRGKTIIDGHVSFHETPGPLYKLADLGVHDGKPDQVVLEGKDGKKHTYEYVSHDIIKDPKDKNVWKKVFAKGDPENPQLVLVSCTGPVSSRGLHAWRIVDYLKEVKEPGTNGTANVLTTNVDKQQTTQTETIKFADQTKAPAPLEKPVVTSSIGPAEKPAVTTTSMSADNSGTTAPLDKPAVTSVIPNIQQAGVTTKETHSPSHSVELLTNGSQTLVNYYSKDFNVGTGLNGAKPTFLEVGHTSTLLNNGRDYASNTITGGLAFGSQFNTSKTLSITDHGPYISNQLYYDHRLNRTDGTNNTFLFANGGLSYQPSSHYNLQAYGSLGLRQDFGKLSLYGGAGDYSANHLSPTISPFAGASYRINKATTFDVNYSGRSWMAGVGIHF